MGSPLSSSWPSWLAAALLMRRSQDDVHSVEHYHRQLHTLEEIRSHPSVPTSGPATAAGTTATRGPRGTARPGGLSGERVPRLGLTDRAADRPRDADRPAGAASGRPQPGRAGHVRRHRGSLVGRSAGVKVRVRVRVRSRYPSTSFMRGDSDKAMHSIDHRPRRLGAPLAAIGVVTVLIIVLIVTGLHSDTKPPRHGSSSTATTTTVHNSTTVPAHDGGHGPTGEWRRPRARATTTTTTAPPAVSAATAATAHAATYDVAAASYSLSLAASSGECWVEAENPATGTVLFSGTLFSGPVAHRVGQRSGRGDRRCTRARSRPRSTACRSRCPRATRRPSP